MTETIIVKSMTLRLQEPNYYIDQFLLRGAYSLIVTVPFDTQLAVTLQNPLPGFQFFPDGDPSSFIWNSRMVVPADGQYRFLVKLDRPIMAGEMQVQFILIQQAVPPVPSPPATPPWPPTGSAQQIWDNPYYQAIIRRLHPNWVAEENQRIRITQGPGWYVDPWGRGINPPHNWASGPPDGIGGNDAPMWCWFNLSGFQQWIIRNGP
jgi:hypothetical protein